ncbi:cyclase family protein [Amycolatopsis sp. NPDC051903]|uniref:cyclase family protein n=1 Tax=Amycolatopsis sp. NPDC051903 TaxID=3363936 RepID=UPI0037A66725
MTVLSARLAATCSGVRVVDLTTPLREETPIRQPPEPFANTSRFRLEELSRYDGKGHLGAPVHWITGRDGLDVARAPLSTVVTPAVVLDRTVDAGADPDFLLRDRARAGVGAEDGALADAGWLLHRTGRAARGADAAAFANADIGSRTPGVDPECARWQARETPIAGFGVETVGADAGPAPAPEPAFPCRSELMGAGKPGLTSLRSLGELPPGPC